MNRRGSLLLELVIALGILTGCSITISGVLVRSAHTIDSSRTEIEAADLAGSALTMIQTGALTPEAAERLTDLELHAMLTPDSPEQLASDARYELVIETEPTSWRSLTTVRVSVVTVGGETDLAIASGVVNLGRARDSRPGRFDP